MISLHCGCYYRPINVPIRSPLICWLPQGETRENGTSPRRLAWAQGWAAFYRLLWGKSSIPQVQPMVNAPRGEQFILGPPAAGLFAPVRPTGTAHRSGSRALHRWRSGGSWPLTWVAAAACSTGGGGDRFPFQSSCPRGWLYRRKSGSATCGGGKPMRALRSRRVWTAEDDTRSDRLSNTVLAAYRLINGSKGWPIPAAKQEDNDECSSLT